MQKRGQLTQRIKDRSKELFGYEISQKELRLLPYIHYTMCNEQQIDPNRINQEEREILSFWRKLGYMSGGASEMTITKKFWDMMSEIVWLGYVDLSD